MQAAASWHRLPSYPFPFVSLSLLLQTLTDSTTEWEVATRLTMRENLTELYGVTLACDGDHQIKAPIATKLAMLASNSKCALPVNLLLSYDLFTFLDTDWGTNSDSDSKPDGLHCTVQNMFRSLSRLGSRLCPFSGWISLPSLGT